MKTLENDWVSTHRAMTECLEERQKFIEKLLADIRKTEDEKKEMLEALKDAVRVMRVYGTHNMGPCIDRCNVAISKAEGRS